MIQVSTTTILLLVWAGFCFTHALRDFLQMKKVKNWFTEFAHFHWLPMLDERLVMSTFLVLGATSLLVAVFIT